MTAAVVRPVDERCSLPLAAPERSVEQRMEALAKANRIRSQRAALKRDLAAGRQHVIRLLVDPPEFILSMKVADLLIASPKWGRVKTNKALSRAAISPTKTVSGLSSRQRQALVEALGGAAGRRSGEWPERRPDGWWV